MNVKMICAICLVKLEIAIKITTLFTMSKVGNDCRVFNLSKLYLIVAKITMLRLKEGKFELACVKDKNFFCDGWTDRRSMYKYNKSENLFFYCYLFQSHIHATNKDNVKM